MEEEKRYIVSIVQRNTIDSDLFLYNHICTAVGIIEEDEYSKIFIDDQGKEYPMLTSDESIYSNWVYAFASPLTIDEAYLEFKEYGPEAQEIMSAYEEKYGRYFYLVATDLMDKKYMCTYNTDSLVDTLTTINDSKTRKYQLDDLEEALNENIFSKEQLQDLKKDIISKTNLAKDLLSNIDAKIKDPTYYSNEAKVEKEQKFKVKESSNQEINNENSNAKSQEKAKSEIKNNINIKKVFNNVTKTLIDQDEAAKRVITEIARLELNDDNRYGILITGSTGVGKTKLMSLIAKYIDRPFFSIDTSQITSPGYTGRNIEECLWDLYKQCNKDISKAERAIIYFDEIDKKGSSRKDDVSGKAVLNILLKFLDGTTYKATENMQHSFSTVDINTSKMIIISSGAFSDVYKSLKVNDIGFSTPNKKAKTIQPKLEDFVEKGMIPDEFMGRFPVIVHLNDLGKQSFINIMNCSNESPLKIEKENFKKFNIDLEFTEPAKEAIATKAEKLKTGARGLKGIVLETTHRSFEYASENKDNIEKIIITKETVENNENFKVKEKSKTKSKVKRR